MLGFLESFGAVIVVLGCMGLCSALAELAGAALPTWARLGLGVVGLFVGYGVGRALVRRYYRIS